MLGFLVDKRERNNRSPSVNKKRRVAKESSKKPDEYGDDRRDLALT
jgi:hypothetical protein